MYLHGSNNRHLTKFNLKYLAYFPIIGLAIYLVLSVVAATLYPGGSYNEPYNTLGYSFFDNFFCDVMNATTESGLENEARPLAIISHLLLSLIMIVFFYILPEIFEKPTRNTKIIRYSGVIGMVLFIFMFTKYHNYLVVTTAIFGTLAFLALLQELKKYANKGFKILTLCVLAISVIVFFTYQTRIGFYYTPILQKTAFFIDAALVVWTSVLVIKKSKR